MKQKMRFCEILTGLCSAGLAGLRELNCLGQGRNAQLVASSQRREIDGVQLLGAFQIQVIHHRTGIGIVPEPKYVTDFMDGYPVRLRRRQRDRGIEDDPALEIPAVGKLRAGDHVLGGRFK